MIQSVSDDAHLAAAGELQEMFGLSAGPKEEQEQKESGDDGQKQPKESDQAGFLGQFNTRRQAQELQEQRQDQQHMFQQNQAIVDLHTTI